MAWWCWARAAGPRAHRYGRAGPGRGGRERAGSGGRTPAPRPTAVSPRRLTVLLEPRRGFRRARPRTEEPTPATAEPPAAEARPAPPRRSLCPPPPARAGRPPARRLVRPLLFAVGVSGSAGGEGAGGGPASGRRPGLRLSRRCPVHRHRLRGRCHLAVRGAQGPGPDVFRGSSGGLAGQNPPAEEGRLQKAGTCARTDRGSGL